MLRCVAAACVAAFLIGWPAHSAGDDDTFWDKPNPAALAWRHLFGNRTQADVTAFAQPRDPSQETSPVVEAPHAPNPAPVAAPVQATSEPQQPHDRGRLIIFSEPDPVVPHAPQQAAAEPFGLDSFPVSFGGIVDKWTGVEASIHAEADVLEHCRADAVACPREAQSFLQIIKQGQELTGLARIGAINRAVNMAIAPVSDMAQWGVPDRWSPPLETFATGRGDCEDYAIAKYVALAAAGVAAQDIKLVVVRNTAADEDHAVVAVRNDGKWIILDNRWLMLVEDAAMQKALPRFVLDASGVREFMPATLTVARQSSPAPVSLVN